MTWQTEARLDLAAQKPTLIKITPRALQANAPSSKAGLQRDVLTFEMLDALLLGLFHVSDLTANFQHNRGLVGRVCVVKVVDWYLTFSLIPRIYFYVGNRPKIN